MDQTTFDRITKTLATGANRRTVLGGLATGLAATLTGAPLVAGAIEAERRKKKKPKTCRRGQRLARVRVPASGATALTPVLKRGQRYRLRASGIIATNAVAGQDAEFGFLLATPADPKTLIDVFQGLDVGISIDGASPNWGPYNLAHVYEQVVVGRGRALSLQLLDTQHSDNTGNLIVDVFCA